MLLSLALSAAAVTAVRATIPVAIQGSLEHDACSNGVVTGLNPKGDRFLSVRSGPGTKHRELARLFNGQKVYVCDSRGDWIGIVYERPSRAGCDVTEPWPETLPYTGPCRSGWVHRRWIKVWAD